ncbi:DUF2690 domain-containing protein [Streptomyces sp. NPDC048301]|uniref:DUF2690 domain-containing protein n=1 Tax=Streptomyces sp. NPDC048301 TaxID=3155631 RepID=UPI00341C60E8
MRLICGIGPDTLASDRTATGAHVELRHSEKCGASWARIWGPRSATGWTLRQTARPTTCASGTRTTPRPSSTPR